LWEIQRGRSNVADLPRSEARATRRPNVSEIDPWAALASDIDHFLGVESYNGFTLRSTPETNAKAHGYLDTVRAFNSLPQPELTPDGEGGLDIEWENKGKHLALSINTAEPDFISWREPEGRYEGAEATPELLNDRLEWLRA